MDIQNVAVKFLTNKVNSNEELSKEQLKKWLTPLPDNVSKHIKKNIFNAVLGHCEEEIMAN